MNIKKISFSTLLLLFSCILAFSNIALSDDEDTTPKLNAQSIELNEQGVAIINKDPKKAVELFRKALSIDNRNISALLNYATLKISEKKGNEIINMLEAYSKTYPKVSDIHYLLGDVYFANKDIDSALKSYKKVLVLKPNTKGLFSKLGNIYILQKDLKKALFMYDTAYNDDPKNVEILNNYASLLLANHDIPKAIKIAKDALNLKETPESYVTLATAYEMQKDIPLALENYKKAKSLNSTQSGLDQKIKDLDGSLEAF